MPKKTPDAIAALQKLGEHLRAGIAKTHPAQHLDAVRAVVRAQYVQQQEKPRAGKAAPDATKAKPQRKPPERGLDR